jgi:plastocyanin
MSKRHLVTGSSAIAVLFAFLATSAAFGSNRQGGVTIKATDNGETYVINKSASDRMYFRPGTVSVKSGSTLTFTYEGKPASEPHTISVVARKDLPGTDAQINACENGGNKVCNAIIGGLIRNPKAPPGPSNDIAHWTVDKGSPGLDGTGDSIAIEGAKHSSISIKVTAPAGTKLSFFCVVHPWMHGTINVT